MLDHGIRHLPVVDTGGGLLGVLDDVDLMASERRAPFRLRALIARSGDPAAVAAAAAELPSMAIDLHDAAVPAAAIGRMMSGIHDTIARRLVELAQNELGPPPVAWTWLATGRERSPRTRCSPARWTVGGARSRCGSRTRTAIEG